LPLKTGDQDFQFQLTIGHYLLKAKERIEDDIRRLRLVRQDEREAAKKVSPEIDIDWSRVQKQIFEDTYLRSKDPTEWIRASMQDSASFEVVRLDVNVSAEGYHKYCVLYYP
jgi:hypothetical protein